jgi:hypothetical protein
MDGNDAKTTGGTVKKVSVFELERCMVPYEDWFLYKDKLPKGVWTLLENHMTDLDNYGMGCVEGLGMGYREDVGHFVLGSGQGPCVVWMEKPQPTSGPYPYNPNEKRYDYDDAKPEKKFLTEREWIEANDE